jgi:pSer/pThr/pTyr-binding forkhead associated (FHA) protein
MEDPLKTRSAKELQERLGAERCGEAVLVYRDGDGAQHIHTLSRAAPVVVIGRNASCDIAIGWDAEVSRVHARIECVGSEWTLVDDGRSRNGTRVNDVPAHRRVRLHHGDTIELGRTAIAFLNPAREGSASTVTGARGNAPSISEAQRRVLVALCAPYADSRVAAPASNRAIANELYLGVETVKTHLRDLFRLFGIEDLPQNQKRAALARRALTSGLVVLPPMVTRER